MEVAQDGGQAAHVVGVGVGQGHRVEAADAARPQHLGDDLLADVEVLRGLARAAAEAAAIHQQGFAVGGDQQQGVALAHVDGLHEQRVARVIDGRGAGRQRAAASSSAAQARRRAPAGSRRNSQAGQHDGRPQQRAEGGRLPEKRRGNAEVAQGHRAEEMHQPDAEVKKQSHKHGRNHCGRRPDQRHQQRDQRGRHQHQQAAAG